MSKPDAPTPPSPQATATAQTNTNVSTAVANAYLGHVNQVTPTGNLDYNQTGSYGWTDPSSGYGTYNIPTFTATQTQTPQGQAIQNQDLAAQYNLAGMANAQSGRISGLLANSMDPNFNAAGYLAANPDVYQYALKRAGPDVKFLGRLTTAWRCQHPRRSNRLSGAVSWRCLRHRRRPQAQTYLGGHRPAPDQSRQSGPIATS